MTTRLRHTPCAQPIDFTPGQQLLEPDSAVAHQCPINGPFHVVRHWTRWSISDVLDRTRSYPTYDTHAEALTEAIRRNTADLERRRPRPPQPAQPDLFTSQEAI